jgi:hypothetical protein
MKPGGKANFDYSKLGRDFEKLSKPAKRALINKAIYSEKDLAKHTKSEVAGLHAIGPSSMPILEAALKKSRLDFKR